MSAFFSSTVRFLKKSSALRAPSNAAFFVSGNSLPTSSSTANFAMAGEAVSPGDSMPARWITPLDVLLSSMMKSCVPEYARTPANEVMVLNSGGFLHILRTFSCTNANPAAQVAVSGDCVSSAVGPSRILLSAVCVTRMPLPSFVGVKNSV